MFGNRINKSVVKTLLYNPHELDILFSIGI